MVVSAGLTTAMRVRQAAEEAKSKLLSLQSALKAARAEKVCRSPCASSYVCHMCFFFPGMVPAKAVDNLATPDYQCPVQGISGFPCAPVKSRHVHSSVA